MEKKGFFFGGNCCWTTKQHEAEEGNKASEILNNADTQGKITSVVRYESQARL